MPDFTFVASRHCVEIFHNEDVSKYAAIFFLSGDTTFNEGLQGLFEQYDRNEVLDTHLCLSSNWWRITFY